MYTNRRIRPAKLSVRGGESIDVLVSLTKEFNTLDGRSHIVGSLQARTWIAAPEGIEVFDLSLEDGRKMEIYFTRQPLPFLNSADADDFVEAEFIDAKSMEGLNNGN